MFANKKLIIIIVILSLLLLGIIFLNLIPQNNNAIPQSSPSPAQVYDLNNAETDYRNRIAYPSPLDEKDTTIKAKLINNLSGGEGTVIENSSYKIEYIKSLDLFSINILTTNVEQTKLDSVQWLQQQGFTLAGICNLPIFFYIDPTVANKLQKEGKTFDPTPQMCRN